ncbi:phosphatase [Actinoplanes capillaceus]|uniref:Phosphatase n=1 Tax=Actinoplanes campanulatus TaxID=113559 RepID=A0ABQ3WLY7_9ACTN|nr:phosphatase [Actinoplanes capillaceus]
MVRRGQVYRSAGLHRLAGTDAESFAHLGIRVVYDLRTARERQARPDNLSTDIRTVALDVLADSSDAAVAHLGDVGVDASTLNETLAAGVGEGLMRDSYRDVVTLPSALSAYHDLYAGIADPRQRPVLFHCTTGKDRTGWGAAALLLLLGVDEQSVRDDYLQTNSDLLPALAPIIDDLVSRGVERDLLLPVLEVREEYLDTALEQMRSRYGTIENYFTAGLHLHEHMIDSLRDALVQR